MITGWRPDDMGKRHWQDRVTILIGIWIFLTPWVLPYLFPEQALTGRAAWAHHLVGGIFVALSLSAIVTRQDWQEWANCLAALCLIVSPWILNFTNATMLSLNAVLLGLIVLMLSAYVALTESMDVT